MQCRSCVWQNFTEDKSNVFVIIELKHKHLLLEFFLESSGSVSCLGTQTRSCTSVIMLINPAESGQDDQAPLLRCSTLAQLVFSWPPKVTRSVLIRTTLLYHTQHSLKAAMVTVEGTWRHH